MSVPPTVVTDEASLNLAIQAFDAFTVANTYTIDIGNNITEGIELYAINNAHTNIRPGDRRRRRRWPGSRRRRVRLTR